MNAIDCPHQKPGPFPSFRKLAGGFAGITRIPRRILLGKTALKSYLTAGSALCLIHAGLRWQGARMLRAEQERVAALGVARDWKDLELPIPADADNFFAAPPFAGLFEQPYPEAPQLALWMGWRPGDKVRVDPELSARMHSDPTLAEACAYFRSIGTLPEESTKLSPAQALAADSRFLPVIQSIYQAADRPEARWPVPVSGEFRRGFLDLLRMARGIQFYAAANLELEHPSQALAAFRVFRLLVRAAGDYPTGCEMFLDCQRQLLLEGMRRHRIPEEALRSILAENYPEMMRKAAGRGMAIHRVHFVVGAQDYRPNWSMLPLTDPWRETLEGLGRRFTLPYTLARDTVRDSRYYSERIVMSRALGEGETWASRRNYLDSGFQSGNPAWRSGHSQQSDFSWEVIRPVLVGTLHHLAAALELHWLKQGRYPATLAGLESGLPETALRDAEGRTLTYTAPLEGAHFSLSAGERIQRWSTLPEVKE